MKKLISLALIFVASFTQSVTAQSGGNFQITQSVIAGGGGKSSGGNFSIEGTTGQSISGTRSAASGNQFTLLGGFWTPDNLAPTAATVSLRGRIVINEPAQMSRVRVVAQNLSTGVSQSATPNAFGYYFFTELETGFYVIQVKSRNYLFTPANITFELTEDRNDIDFTGMRMPD